MQYDEMLAAAQPNHVDIGDGELARANEILRTEVGSGVHGMAIAGTDDHDEMGIYVETPEQVVGLAPASHHWVWRTQPMGARSHHGDVDLTLYALRKVMRLLLEGNPTVLILLYAQGDAVMACTPMGEELRALAPKIVSQVAGRRFLGYLDAQRGRMVGDGHRARVPNRPELIERYGYDTKFASHALRLGRQGVELMTTGHLTLPLRRVDLEPCLAVKSGSVGFETALAWIDDTRAELVEVLEAGSSVLPAEPDRAAVNAWMVTATQAHWREHELI